MNPTKINILFLITIRLSRLLHLLREQHIPRSRLVCCANLSCCKPQDYPTDCCDTSVFPTTYAGSWKFLGSNDQYGYLDPDTPMNIT